MKNGSTTIILSTKKSGQIRITFNFNTKTIIHGYKVFLCIWLDQKDVFYYKLLKPSETITAEYYSRQLYRLPQDIDKKRLWTRKKESSNHFHNNAQPYVVSVTKDTLMKLKEVLLHPTYSPDLVPSHYYLFRSIHNHRRCAILK